jgi:glutamate carboxypeptidase
VATGPPVTALREDEARALLAGAEHRAEAMVADLLTLAGLESPSADPAAQTPVLDHLDEAFARRGLRTRRFPAGTSGGMLLAAGPAGEEPQPFQLLIGHADTVWPRGTAAARPPTVADGRVSGPGTYDMKAGLVQLLTALDLLADIDRRPSVAPVVLVNTDEEIGSRGSTPAVQALSAAADRVYVLEPSLGSAGALKTARKGLGRYTVTVHGRAAHAGLDPTAGASAILELSAVIQSLFALNDAGRGVTVNVGMVSGGIQPNVVAPESSAVVDVRVLTAQDAEQVDAAIRALEPTTPGTSLSVTGGMGRPPLERTERNQRLFASAQQVAALLGVELSEATAGGGSDGNTASLLAPTLDGLGAVGDGAHAEHEFVTVAPWVQRCALLAGLLLLPPVRASAAVADPVGLVPATTTAGAR